MRLTSSLALSTIVASLGSASLASSDLHQLITRSSLLLRRAPDPCVPICTFARNSVQACKTSTCVCTMSMAVNLQSCVTCVITNDSNSVAEVSYVEQLASVFNTACATFAGVPPLTLLNSPTPSTLTSQGVILPTTTSSSVSQTSSSTTATVAVSAVPVPETSIVVETVGATGTAADPSTTGGLPVTASAICNEIVLHGIGAWFGLVLGVVLVI
ncbi:hypothetical protein BYT27DRAFT_6464064 [Phlegmacium glaucopus]|nr:hypothetical protein BYT27DRAFT_6464064 [Phlegmacium glaucopus]